MVLPFQNVPKVSTARKMLRRDGHLSNVLVTTVHALPVTTVRKEQKIPHLVQKVHSQDRLVLGIKISAYPAHQDGFAKPSLELVVFLHQVSLVLLVRGVPMD